MFAGDMNPIQEIVAYLKTVPFRPFVIHTTDGREFPVLHPDFLTITPRGKILYERDEKSTAFISPLHVVSVESLPETATA